MSAAVSLCSLWRIVFGHLRTRLHPFDDTKDQEVHRSRDNCLCTHSDNIEPQHTPMDYVIAGKRRQKLLLREPPCLTRAQGHLIGPRSAWGSPAPNYLFRCTCSNSTSKVLSSILEVMPSVRHIPDNKRRSRTGCLTCRKRRRKCKTARLT